MKPPKTHHTGAVSLEKIVRGLVLVSVQARQARIQQEAVLRLVDGGAARGLTPFELGVGIGEALQLGDAFRQQRMWYRWACERHPILKETGILSDIEAAVRACEALHQRLAELSVKTQAAGEVGAPS